MSEDLSVLREKQFSDALTRLEELMTHGGRVFLLGAGCSKCAGLPLTAQLTSEVLADSELGESSKEILLAIQANFAGAEVPNIEDYLSELVDQLAVAERRALKSALLTQVELGGKKYDASSLRLAVEEIKRSIAKIIDKDQVNIDTHWRFVKALHRPIRPGAVADPHRVDYLVLNYDTLIETALALEKVVFADGLVGGVTGWWDASCFEREGLSARVFKLHGSIDWRQLDEEALPRRVPKSVREPNARARGVVIWPASTKYRETQFDPYAQLASLARGVLRPRGGEQRVVVVCGYKFGDSHINLELDRALRESLDLTVVVFWSEEALDGQIKAWHEDSDVRSQVLIFGKRGFWHGQSVALATTDLPWWRFEVLARLLGGER